MSIEKLDEVLILLKSHELEASQVIVDGDLIQVAGLRKSDGPHTKKPQQKLRKEPTGRDLMFMHTGIVPKHREAGS